MAAPPGRSSGIGGGRLGDRGFAGRNRDRERAGKKSPAKGPDLSSAVGRPSVGGAGGLVNPGAGAWGSAYGTEAGGRLATQDVGRATRSGMQPVRDPVTGRVGVNRQGFDAGAGLAAAIGLVSPPVGTGLGVLNKLTGSPLTIGGGFVPGAELSSGPLGAGLSEPGENDRGERMARVAAMPSGRAPNQGVAGFARPSAMSMPASLSRILNSAMTPLQSRSAIATHGTQGGGPNDRDALEYWRNLFTRDFVDDSGQFRPLDDPYNSFLPVEQQWLQQAFGFSPPTGGDTRSLLEALAAY